MVENLLSRSQIAVDPEVTAGIPEACRDGFSRQLICVEGIVCHLRMTGGAGQLGETLSRCNPVGRESDIFSRHSLFIAALFARRDMRKMVGSVYQRLAIPVGCENRWPVISCKCGVPAGGNIASDRVQIVETYIYMHIHVRIF